MAAPEPIKLLDIDNYVEDLATIAEKANRALNLCLRARMAVSAGAQQVAYAHLAQVGTLLAEIYQAGDGTEVKPDRTRWRLHATSSLPGAAAVARGTTLQGEPQEHKTSGI